MRGGRASVRNEEGAESADRGAEPADWRGVRKGSAALLGNFECGKRFPYELALAAIPVALATRPTPFAEEFVLDLARLELAELPIAIRVAREACQERLAVSASKTKMFTLVGEEAVPTEWRRAGESRQVMVGQSIERFELEAS